MRFSTSGQASVEAACLLPIVMLLVGLLVQPICVLYTKSVMGSTAAELLRVATTNSDTQELVAYGKRRLEAVPEVALFHVGGEDDWIIEMDGISTNHASVAIRGHTRLLPVLGAGASLLGKQDGQGLVLEVHLQSQTRPKWLGGSYGSWLQVWK